MDENSEAANRRLERLRLEHTHSMELLRATVAFEHAALKPPMLLNGGAVVVFLALFGALKAKSGDVSVIDENWVLWAILAWIAGLLSGTFATGKGYYSQLAFRKAHDHQLRANRERELATIRRPLASKKLQMNVFQWASTTGDTRSFPRVRVSCFLLLAWR